MLCWLLLCIENLLRSDHIMAGWCIPLSLMTGNVWCHGPARQRLLSAALLQYRTVSTRNLYGYPNSKWIARYLKSASNRVSIRKTYFGLPEKHNSNIDILSPENQFTESILFWVLLLEKMPNMYWTFYLQRYPKNEWVLYFGYRCWR